MREKEAKQGNWFSRHKILTGLLAFIVLIIVVSVASGGSKDADKSSTGSKSNSANSSTKATSAKLGEAARDGQFEFTVKSLTCGKPSVTDNSGYLTKTAQGQYCLMDVTVKNIGDKQQYFSESDQKILNAAGLQYSPDSTATIYNSNSSDVFTSQINPGNSVTGVIVFDIPKDQTPVSAELHDSSLSGGVKVTVQ